MKGIFSHLVALLLGAALASLWFAGPGGQRPRQAAVISQPGPAAEPVMNAPSFAVAANPKAEAKNNQPDKGQADKVKTQLSAQLAAQLAAMGVDAGAMPPALPHYNDLAVFHKDFKSFADKRIVDEASQANEKAIWDSVAALQQKVDVDIQDLACQGDQKCLFSLRIADGDDSGKVDQLLMNSLARKVGYGWFTATDYTTRPKSGEPLIMVIQRVKREQVQSKEAGR
ncbi:hypothetical protein PVT67_10370 [Gallaecimonas kandeliae]|uniref:hypothetical protein n=1 Tax=Gallaecimonas kandeliae TaxID=3029055 RepID=UPI00264799F8|nr:hypothetical protein [Gallaecimonas kandeliae]WKE64101.1 hypothetical protein PVT67_10370 [Gallaecimonas kandeliae]